MGLFPEPQIKLPAGSASPGVNAKEKSRENKGSWLTEWCPHPSTGTILQNGACSPNLALFTNTMQLASFQYCRNRWAHIQPGEEIAFLLTDRLLYYVTLNIPSGMECALPKIWHCAKVSCTLVILPRLRLPCKALLEQLCWLWMLNKQINTYIHTNCISKPA